MFKINRLIVLNYCLRRVKTINDGCDKDDAANDDIALSSSRK